MTIVISETETQEGYPPCYRKLSFKLPSSTDPAHITKRGLEILNDPWLNKGTSFSDEERETLGLKGLLPPFRADMEEQVQRVMENYWHHTDPLDKYTFLIGLADRNVTLFYRVLMEHLLEMTPIMYTPPWAMPASSSDTFTARTGACTST